MSESVLAARDFCVLLQFVQLLRPSVESFQALLELCLHRFHLLYLLRHDSELPLHYVSGSLELASLLRYRGVGPELRTGVAGGFLRLDPLPSLPRGGPPAG